MEPALDVIHRALHGDEVARAFLERTSSIYALDVTDPLKPKTYGCWNFIHQAMNEVERYEAAYVRSNQVQALEHGAGLVSHVRLLATMALRVARRSPATDKALIITCLANAEKFEASDSQSKWLIDLNSELREIVMGRIAAMAFDFSFHRRTGPNGHSAFADQVVMDTFCAILSSNAVASGPASIQHFMTEWIIPSVTTLPAYALVSVVYHLATEGARKTAPAGTKDMMQQLSVQTVAVVLLPVLSTAIEESTALESQATSNESSAQVTAMSLRAVTAWCEVTELSLPQIRHIGNKVSFDFVNLISDAMYSDSALVVDALADFIDALVLGASAKIVTEERMRQVRYIIQVDEMSFQERFTPEQLKTIEAKEMESIVEELLSAVGLQRFRFVERQKLGDHGVCRNLARIAATVCATCLQCSTDRFASRLDPGVIQLLLKAAGHVSVHISAIALSALVDAAKNGLVSAEVFLPLLQQRAIAPHLVAGDGKASLVAFDLCGVAFDEFESVRYTILTEALRWCWQSNRNNYLDSCTSAIEEFCGSRPTVEISFQLEAALFCIETVAEDVTASGDTNDQSNQLRRCATCLKTMPEVLMSNPLTSFRACRLIHKLAHWFAHDGSAASMADLALSVLRRSLENGPNQVELEALARETGYVLHSEACTAIKSLCNDAPKDFLGAGRVEALRDAWSALYTAKPSVPVKVGDRLSLCSGIFCVLACVEPSQQSISFDEISACALNALDKSTRQVIESGGSLESLVNLVDDINTIARLPRILTDVSCKDEMESGCDTSPDTHAAVSDDSLHVLKRSWSSVTLAAENFSNNEIIADSLRNFLSALLPMGSTEDSSFEISKEILDVAARMARPKNGQPYFDTLFAILQDFVLTKGEMIEHASVATVRGSHLSENDKVICQSFERLMLHVISGARSKLGAEWTSPKEQGNGQSALESSEKKPPSRRDSKETSKDCLAGMLDLLTVGLERCPTFVSHLPAGQGLDRDEDPLVRRATKAAAASLSDYDVSIVSSSIKFLCAAALLTSSQTSNVNPILSDSFSGVSLDVLTRLVGGICGKLDRGLIANAAELIASILTRTPDSHEFDIQMSSILLQNGSFCLGKQAELTTLSAFRRCSQGQLSTTELAIFLQDIWDLHQVEDTSVLPFSDQVARFVRRYSS